MSIGSLAMRALRCLDAEDAHRAAILALRAAARSSGTVSRIEVPAVVTSSTISTRSPSRSGRPTSTPPSPWSFASLRLKQKSTSRPRSAKAIAIDSRLP